MGVAIKPAPNGLGPLNTAKSFTHSVDIFDQLLALSCNHVFKIISPHPPPFLSGLLAEGVLPYLDGLLAVNPIIEKK